MNIHFYAIGAKIQGKAAQEWHTVRLSILRLNKTTTKFKVYYSTCNVIVRGSFHLQQVKNVKKKLLESGCLILYYFDNI